MECVVFIGAMVARIDGRGFTRLTKEVHKFDAPYDERFRDYKEALNPVTGEAVKAAHRRIKRDLQLPMKDEYSAFVKGLLEREHDLTSADKVGD